MSGENIDVVIQMEMEICMSSRTRAGNFSFFLCGAFLKTRGLTVFTRKGPLGRDSALAETSDDANDALSHSQHYKIFISNGMHQCCRRIAQACTHHGKSFMKGCKL
jgi:hypothetical protein